jgi:hypothetical protein
LFECPFLAWTQCLTFDLSGIELFKTSSTAQAKTGLLGGSISDPRNQCKHFAPYRTIGILQWLCNLELGIADLANPTPPSFRTFLGMSIGIRRSNLPSRNSNLALICPPPPPCARIVTPPGQSSLGPGGANKNVPWRVFGQS